MKHIGFEVGKILIERKIQNKFFAEQLSMSDINLSNIISNESIDALLLEKIAKLLKISISFFFDDDYCSIIQNGNAKRDIVLIGKGNISINESEKLKIENKFLKRQIKDKEEIINLLKNK